MRAIHLLFILCSSISFGQESVQLKFDTLYSIPGNNKQSSLADLSAKTDIRVTPDSLIFSVTVKDDELRTESDIESSDRVEIWFGYPWLDFADFVVGNEGKKTRIFRNTAEAGDNADVKRFLNDGDYPEGNLTQPGSGNLVEPEVPRRESLRREMVFAGLVQLVFRVDGSEIIHANREKYSSFEEQTGYKLGDLSKYASYTSRKTEDGYEMKIRLSNQCLGFARPEVMNKIRLAVDVYDIDTKSKSVKGISSAKNRYYARSFYMNEIDLPFKMNIKLSDFPSEMVSSLKINQDAVCTTQGWKGFGISSGSIVYAKDLISETGLQEFYFHKTTHLYSKIDKPFEIERIDITYDDLSIFKQHEVYLKVGENVISGKKYRYTGIEKNSFFYLPKKVSDTSFVIAIYDYEAVDPLGFGEFGHTADEFIYVLEIGPKGQKSVFNSGQRLEAAKSVALGEEPPLIVKDVKSLDYEWTEGGQGISIKTKGIKKEGNREIIFKRDSQGIFVLQ